MEGKIVEESKIVMARLMQPADANSSGNVHGGIIMKNAARLSFDCKMPRAPSVRPRSRARFTG